MASSYVNASSDKPEKWMWEGSHFLPEYKAAYSIARRDYSHADDTVRSPTVCL